MIWTNDHHMETGVGARIIFMTALVCRYIAVAAQTNEAISGSDRAPEFRCESEGIYPDPNNCLVFYRCIDSSGLNNALQNEYNLFKFECAPDTVFNPETSACEAPADPSSAECANKKNPSPPKTSPNRNGYLPPVPSQSGSPPSVIQHPSEQIELPADVNNSLDNPIASTTAGSGTDDCRSDGFFSIPGNCTYFYRCVGNGDAGFIKHDFFCADNTIWDPYSNTCNYPEAVQRTDCAISGDVRSEFSDNPRPENENTYPKVGTSDEEPDTCTSEGFHPVEGDCTKFSRCVNIGEGKLIKYNFDCAEGTVWDRQLNTCNYPNAIDRSSCESRSNETASPQNDTLSDPQSSTPPSTAAVQDKCTAEGFFPSSDDCNKFYRCVRTAYDTYVMYNFNCGPGTVWDPVNNVCNYPEAVAGCGSGASNPPSSTNSSSSSSSIEEQSRPTSVSSMQDTVTVAPMSNCSSISPVPPTTTSGSSDQTYGNKTTADITEQTTARTAPVINATSVTQTERTSPLTVSPTTVSEPVNGTTPAEDITVCKERITKIQCTAEGYYPHPDDSRKFYRCVNWDENKNGSFSIFHFDCPAGTIFDPNTNNCNHYSSTTYAQPKYCSDTTSASASLSPLSSTDSTRLSTGKSTVTAGPTDISGRLFNPSDDATAASTEITMLPTRPVTDNGTATTAEQRASSTEAITKTTTQFPSSAATAGTTTERRSPSTTIELSSISTVSSATTVTTSPTDMMVTGKTTATEESVTRTTQLSTETGESLSTTAEKQSSSTMSIEPSTQTAVTTGNTTATESDVTEETVTKSTQLPFTSDQSTNSTAATTESHSTVEPSTVTTVPPTTLVAETVTSQTSTQPATSSPAASQTTIVSEQPTRSTDESTLNYSATSQSADRTTLSSTETISTVQPTTMTEERLTSTNPPTTISSVTDQLPSTTFSPVTQSTLASENQTIPSPTVTTIATTASTKNSNSSTVSSRIYQDNPAPDEFSLVCPTALRRHPNYCNLLYQCTVSPTFEIKVVTLSCLNGTVYDQKKSQCLPRDESEPCDGTIAEVQAPAAVAMGMPLSPIPLKPRTKICPTIGSHPYPGNCKLFYKCKQGANGGSIEGHIYQCPNNYNYWNVSKRCEKSFKVPCNSVDGDETKLMSSLAPNETQDIGTRR